MRSASAGGVGVRPGGVPFADDLPGTGSKTCVSGVPVKAISHPKAVAIFRAIPRCLGSGLLRSPSPASKAPTAFGQNQKRRLHTDATRRSGRIKSGGCKLVMIKK